MTAKRDLKKRVRERQAKTGESYVTARRTVVARAPAREPPAGPSAGADRPSAIPVEEMLDLSAESRRIGIQCGVMMAASLARRIDPVAAVLRVRDALLATEDDPATRVLRAAVLRGESPVLPRRTTRAWMEDARRFVARVRAGIGGVNDTGTMLALHVDGTVGPVMMIAHVGWRSRATATPGVPRLMLSSADRASGGLEAAMYAFIP